MRWPCKRIIVRMRFFEREREREREREKGGGVEESELVVP